MKQIDLDDLPPRVATALLALQPDEQLVLVQGGAVVGRLAAAADPRPQTEPEPPPDQDMKEVMEHFSAMIHDEF